METGKRKQETALILGITFVLVLLGIGLRIAGVHTRTLEYDESGRLVTKDHTLTLIPYYAWAHRGAGNMAVWLPQ